MVALDSAYVEPAGSQVRLSGGMLVSVEVHLSSRTMTEYVLCPVHKTVHEAGR
jgi:hypothetical protein